MWKTLRSLPNTWKPKVMAIQEGKDLKALSLDHFLSSLCSQEMILGEGASKKKKWWRHGFTQGHNLLKENYDRKLLEK